MTREAIGFGETVDEAKERALTELAVDWKEDVQYEVLEMPRKKILGLFGGAMAKVRAFIETPDPKVKNEPKAPVASPQYKKDSAPCSKNPPPKAADTASVANKQQPLSAKSMATNLSNKNSPSPSLTKYTPDVNLVDPELLDSNSPAKKSCNYLKAVLHEIGCGDVTITVGETEDGALIMLEGENLGIVIGHRGETLDALQYLASLSSNTKGGGYYRVVLNIGNYREKREQTLHSLAKRTANQVLRTSRNRTLEPMNPYERRIIHTAVQEIAGVVSNSVGEGSNRRVVISPSSGNSPFSGRDRDTGNKSATQIPRDNSNIPYNNNNRSEDSVSALSSVAPSSDPSPRVDSSSTPLYGRIDK